MRILTFSNRNLKEMLRDKLNLAFGLGFPLIVLLLLTVIGKNVPGGMFKTDDITPGISIFGLSFITLFSGMVISKDRASSFMTRLFASPMTSADFILGYTLPLVPIALGQTAICYLAALLLGLTPTVNILLSIIVSLPASILYIALGLLCGSVLNDKQVGGLCGALLTNLTAWFSGTWFDISLLGAQLKKLAHSLPFVHAVDACKAALNGQYDEILPHLLWVLGYAAIMLTIAIIVFKRKMNSEK